MKMFDADRISTAETDTEYAAYSSTDNISNYLYTILLSLVKIKIDRYIKKLIYNTNSVVR